MKISRYGFVVILMLCLLFPGWVVVAQAANPQMQMLVKGQAVPPWFASLHIDKVPLVNGQAGGNQLILQGKNFPPL